MLKANCIESLHEWISMSYKFRPNR